MPVVLLGPFEKKLSRHLLKCVIWWRGVLEKSVKGVCGNYKLRSYFTLQNQMY